MCLIRNSCYDFVFCFLVEPSFESAFAWSLFFTSQGKLISCFAYVPKYLLPVCQSFNCSTLEV